MRRSTLLLTIVGGLMLVLSSRAMCQPKEPEKRKIDRDRLIMSGGGNRESEVAVARGLAWLALQQKEKGHWEFDGMSKDNVAATGLAILPFLAAGQGEAAADKYAKIVKSGLDWLSLQVEKDGKLAGTSNMYAHAIGALALCDGARVTKDDRLKAKAEQTIQYIVKSQGNNGSWGYKGGTPTEGDTSIVGWQIQALAAAKLAGIKIEWDKVYDPANKFLASVSTDGSKYGYREKGESWTLTPVGLLSRYYMMELSPRHPALGRGIDFIKKYPPQKGSFDMYYYYYATQVVFIEFGPDWHKFWNPKMRDMLIDLQNKGGDDTKRGSWEKDQGFIGSACGKLGTTALAILTLEVYYRYPPLFKRDGGGLKELDR